MTLDTVGKVSAKLLEPRLQVTTGKALAAVGDAAVLVTNQLGKGRAVLVNLPWSVLTEERTKPGLQPTEQLLATVLEGAGVKPFCSVQTPEGERPRCVQQISYTDGNNRYLALFQDILQVGLGEQKAHVRLPEAAYVYDLRAGKALAKGKVSEWDVTIARGWPLVYSLLPYQVTGLTVTGQESVALGGTAEVRGNLKTGGPAAGFHVVRMNVYAPGAKEAHRQYSRNLPGAGGVSTGRISFALNDPRGEWRVELRDVATGVTAQRSILVK